MEKIWAPWRFAYISKPPSKGCFICDIRRARQDAKHFIIERSRHAFSVLNLYPYTNGHVMVVPNRHVKDLSFLSSEELLDVMELVSRTVKKLHKLMRAQGVNVGMNLGRAAGAGVPGHVHIHVVPRWVGDTNFMPVIANTKVISEALKAVYKRLK